MCLTPAPVRLVYYRFGLRFLPLTIMRSEEHTSELQSLMRTSYAVFCLKKKKLHAKHYCSKIALAGLLTPPIVDLHRINFQNIRAIHRDLRIKSSNRLSALDHILDYHMYILDQSQTPIIYITIGF